MPETFSNSILPPVRPFGSLGYRARSAQLDGSLGEDVVDCRSRIAFGGAEAAWDNPNHGVGRRDTDICAQMAVSYETPRHLLVGLNKEWQHNGQSAASLPSGKSPRLTDDHRVHYSPRRADTTAFRDFSPPPRPSRLSAKTNKRIPGYAGHLPGAKAENMMAGSFSVIANKAEELCRYRKAISASRTRQTTWQAVVPH